MAKIKKVTGRPSKYKPEYCKRIIKFFKIKPSCKIKTKITSKDGTVHETKVSVPNDLPLLSKFANSINVNQDTLHEWSKNHKEFSEALKKAKDLQEYILVTNGLKGLYQQPFAIFTAKNVLKWRDNHIISGDTENPLEILIKGIDINNYPNEKKT